MSALTRTTKPTTRLTALAPGANRISVPVDWVDPPARLDNFYGARVCAVDSDGNEVAGIRLPPIAVPLGTYTGWNVRVGTFIAPSPASYAIATGR